MAKAVHKFKPFLVAHMADELMRHEVEQRSLHDTLVASERIAFLGRMLASIMHEINNPLDTLNTTLFLLAETNLDENQRRHVARAQEMIDRVVRISRNTLSFARSSSVKTKVCIPDIIESVLELHAQRIVRQQLHIERCFDCVSDVDGYLGELRQLYANVVRNAIDACGVGGRISIRISSITDNSGRSGVQVCVADNGCGLSPEALEKLGQPFFTTKGEEGTGLGVWICKEIVQKHSGDFAARNQAGDEHGALFTIFIPQTIGFAARVA